MFYINGGIQASLSLCAPRKYDSSGLELYAGEGNPSRVHACTATPVPCPDCVVSVDGPSEPPSLDVWSGLMFTVPRTECWRIWADMSPQCSLPPWLSSHIPSVREGNLSAERLSNGCYLLACVLVCLSLTMWQKHTPARRQWFFCGQRTVHQNRNVGGKSRANIQYREDSTVSTRCYLRNIISMQRSQATFVGNCESENEVGGCRLTVSWCSSRSMRRAILLLNST